MATKNELLATAKELGISGRHEMTKEQLEEVIASEQKKMKRKLVKNTNIPWKRKFYYLDLDKYNEKSEELKKVASQVQLILKFMADKKITTVASSLQGGPICEGAISAGYVRTKIEAHVLFAYYRRKMEEYGLVFAGYDIGEEDGDEIDVDENEDETNLEEEGEE